MGPGIALTLALGGLRVTLLGRTPASVAAGLAKAEAQGRVLSDNQLVGPGEVAKALDMVEGSTDFDGSVAAADLTVESGPEDLAWKQAFFARMDRLVKPEAVLASNTSGLSITAIAAECWPPGARADHAFLEPAAPYAAGGNRPGRADVRPGGPERI